MSVSVAVTDANWFFSPYNWNISGGNATAVNGGAYFKIGFTGTSISISIDVSSMVAIGMSAGNYPYLRYSRDNGAQTLTQLTSGTTAITFSGLSAGSHTLYMELDAGLWEDSGTDRWTTPANCWKITGALLDDGAATEAPVTRTGRMLWYGDSISEGIRANNATSQPTNQNGYESVPQFIAPAFNCELGNVSFGGQGFVSGYGSIPAFNTAYSSIYNGASRLSGGVLPVDPDYVCVWHGANGSPTATNVKTSLTNMRTIAPTASVFIIVPVGGYNSSAITTGFNDYQTATPDADCYLINLGSTWTPGLSSFGSATQQAIDGLHPRSNWNARIACAITQAMQLALGGGSTGGVLTGGRLAR